VAASYNVREKKRAARIFRKIAHELPAHERMKLRILADRPINANQKPLLFKSSQVLLKIRWCAEIRRSPALS